MVKENLKADQYIYALEFMELTLLQNTNVRVYYLE